MRALLHMKAREEELTRGVRRVSTGVEIVLLAQGRFAYMCSEFKCQTAGFPGAKLLDHLVCIDTRVTVRM